MDELHPGYLVGLLVLLVACSAFFSCVEAALLNLDRYRLRLQAKQGLRGARRSSWLLLHDDRQAHRALVTVEQQHAVTLL
ncbi:CNNM domain-containing protein, partial [Pseudomonas aeruginosa]|uniref:CNNM domain-containing protein n=1 Tax=Pseudomonas aeruginosa TaxID=287 RepID=UPI003969900F